MIVQVSVVLRRTVCGDIDRRFNNLSGSLRQSQVMMTSAQVVETSVNVTVNSPSQDYTHPDDHNLPTYCMILMSVASYTGWFVHEYIIFLG